MRILLRIVAVLLVLVALFLLGAVVAAAVFSDGGARVEVAIGYVVGAIVLAFAASKLWNARARTDH